MKDHQFLIFVFYQNHLLAYHVETTSDLETFYLQLQLNSPHLKSFFPDHITLTRKNGVWQHTGEFEKELCRQIDDWILKNSTAGKFF